MLESRYLHLHEALGLGPMWLKQGARLLPPAEGQDGRFQTASDTAQTVHTAPQPAAAVYERAKQPSGNAHAATLAAIGGASRRQSREPSVPKPAEPAANAANTLSDTLQDGIIPQTQADAARLLAVSICPAPADLAAGRLFSGADGVLLDNMLAAIGLTAADCRRTSWLPSVEFSPMPPDCRPPPNGCATKRLPAASAPSCCSASFSNSRKTPKPSPRPSATCPYSPSPIPRVCCASRS